MKKLVCVAAVAVSLLSACATVETSVNGASSGQVASSDAMYCWKDRLQTSDSELYCNWASSAAEACKETKGSGIAKSAIASGPTDARRCDHGQWLVQVTKK
jgi:uncharacterized protein YceK